MLSRDFNCFKGLLGRRQAARPGFGGDLKVACREKRAGNVSESVSGVEFWGFLTADIASIQAKVVSGLQAATRLKAGWRSEGGETKVEGSVNCSKVCFVLGQASRTSSDSP